MARFGIKISNLQSDRGSEYFAQEGDTLMHRDRRQHEFDILCARQSPPILHVLTPVESHEKVAEVWFRDHFRAANAMLWEARLSPAFWADAVAYSQFLFNRIPNAKLPDGATPWSALTGERARWDKFRVFGADVFEHIPNNEYADVPGIPRGRKLIFVGFSPNLNGFRVFDPETRRYFSTSNVYIYEDFSSRIDALRHHDQRRALLKAKAEQPIVMDDFADSNSSAVRNLFLDPDAHLPVAPSFVDIQSPGVTTLGEIADTRFRGAAAQPELLTTSSRRGAVLAPPRKPKVSNPRLPVDLPTFATNFSNPGPLTTRAIAAERAKRLAQHDVMLRPLRLLAIGKEQLYTPEDQAFLDFAKARNVPLVFQAPCPKNPSSAAGRRYRKYMHANSFREAIELGATMDDFRWDYRRGWIRFPKHEPQISGHVFNALELAAEHGHTHALEDAGLFIRDSEGNTTLLAQAFNVRGQRDSFNRILETIFEPEVILKQLEDRALQLRWAEHQMAKVFNSASIKIDFSLAPEPTRFQEVQPEVCAEHERWREAMDDEIAAMVKFGVYRRVPKSAAGTRQILGCRWVYKRKVNKHGQVCRYRARLVAQGFAQRAYDSYQPDETFSPVVHKDTLRLFLSVCAAENLRIYQADVKAAFLQAPLTERIFMKAPPGYSTIAVNGEEEILELSSAIYGLKQSAACFWTAMNAHLLTKGFVSILGDPCLFKKKLSDGKVILACTYIDDVTYGVSDQATADLFLAELRERFVIDEGEGQPIDFLLGMSVSQDIAAGTVHMNMELAISKLVQGILTPQELVKAKSVDYPMLTTPLTSQVTRTVSKDEFDYLSVVGSLLHICNYVRCDIAFAVGKLARFVAAPGPAHVNAAKRVLMYLWNTRSLGITYFRESSQPVNTPVIFERGKHPLDTGANLLQTFVDSDYAMDETRRSTMGTVIMLNGGPISWSSVLGKTVATSTCEAEIYAAVVAAKDALHVQRFLSDLGYADDIDDEDSAVQIAEDNSAAIAQATAGLRHVRNAKHYEIRLRFLQQLVVDKHIDFTYCPTDRQLADLFTKPLDGEKFFFFRDALMHLADEPDVAMASDMPSPSV